MSDAAFNPGEAAFAPNGKPIFTLQQIVNQLTRTGEAWNGTGGNPAPNAGVGTITYAFFNTASQVYSSEQSEFAPLTTAQRNAVREAFAIWGDVINVDFVEGTVATADINLGNLNTTDTFFSAYAYFPGFSRVDGDIWFNTDAINDFEVQIGEAGFRTILHEIGHALGVSHPGNYNASPNVDITYENDAEYYQDSYEYTIMSYFGSSNTGAVRTGFAQTPMAHDIAAMQSLYGANMTTRTGDTVYGFNSTADRSVFNFSTNTNPVLAIWDAGGIDTLDFSGWNSNSVIDLSDGGFSDGGGQTSNVQIAFGTVIENAVGSGGDDQVIGNAADNFFFLQFGGNDTASGFAGLDVFYFGAGFTAADAANGGSGKDIVALQGNYALTLGADDLVEIETLSLLTSIDARFGGQSASPFSYAITTVDANVAAGTTLIVNAATLVIGENFTFNGSAETDGMFFIYAGRGTDMLTGGAGVDVFFFGEDGRFSLADRVDGGGGNDILVLRGDYEGLTAITFAPDAFVNIETISLLSALDTRFAAGGAEYDYDLTLLDANVGAGRTLTINGARGETETMTIDGSAETDGAFRMFAGNSADTLKGGAGNDSFYGNRGADTLSGGAGNNTFRYDRVEESTASAKDQILDFNAGDVIDLSRIDAVSSSPNSNELFSFVGSNAFSNTAGELRAVNISGAAWLIQGDVNGDGIADFELSLTVTDADPITSGDFFL